MPSPRKLTPDDIRLIRELYEPPPPPPPRMTIKKLAVKFEVSTQVIWNIVTRQTYRDIE